MITGWYWPFQASLRASDLGGEVGGRLVQDHLDAPEDQDGGEAREQVRCALLDALAGVGGEAPGQFLDLVDSRPGLGDKRDEGDVGHPAPVQGTRHLLAVGGAGGGGGAGPGGGLERVRHLHVEGGVTANGPAGQEDVGGLEPQTNAWLASSSSLI